MILIGSGHPTIKKCFSLEGFSWLSCPAKLAGAFSNGPFGQNGVLRMPPAVTFGEHSHLPQPLEDCDEKSMLSVDGLGDATLNHECCRCSRMATDSIRWAAGLSPFRH